MLELKSVMEQATGQTLSIKELLKDRTPHRADVLINKITKEEPITLMSGLSVTLDRNKNANIVKVLRTKNRDAYQAAFIKGGKYQPIFLDKQGNAYSINQFAKTAEFGGGGGGISGGKATEELSETGVAVLLGASTVSGKEITPADITLKLLVDGARLVQPVITQQTLRSLQELVTDKTWALSLTQSASALYNNLSMRNKVYHCKGSLFQEAVQAAFNIANKNAKPARPFATQDRWNPADIWATVENIQLPPDDADFEELNNWVLENFNRKRGYGISLKKTGASAQVSFHNMDPTAQRLELLVKELLVSSGNRLESLFSAATSKMTYEVAQLPLSFFYTALQEGVRDEIEYRSRGSAILGTIRGKHAAQGSVGFGTINAVLRSMTGNNITDYVTIRRNLQTPQQKKEVIEEIITMAGTILGTRVDPATKKKLQDVARGRSNEDLIAKYQATELLYHVSNHRKKNRKEADQFLTRLFEYASSQAPLSSAFVKVS